MHFAFASDTLLSGCYPACYRTCYFAITRKYIFMACYTAITVAVTFLLLTILTLFKHGYESLTQYLPQIVLSQLQDPFFCQSYPLTKIGIYVAIVFSNPAQRSAYPNFRREHESECEIRLGTVKIVQSL